MVLLHLLKRLQPEMRFAISAMHVNHQLNSKAEQWEAFCGRLCAGWAIPLVSIRVNVNMRSNLGVEAGARTARYREFARAETDFLVLAHHRDDQAETVLLNAFRGAGVRGLAGMPRARPLAGRGMTLLRPLLEVGRDQISAYAQGEALQWVDDDSNMDVALRRNFLRHDVLPRIERRFPGARTSLVRSAAWSAEAASLLDELAAMDAQSAIDTQWRLDTAVLQRLTLARGKNLLRYWMRQSAIGMPDSRHLDSLLDQLRHGTDRGALRIDLAGSVVRCFRGKAYIESPASPGEGEAVGWAGQEAIAWNDGQVAFRIAAGEGLSRAALSRAPVELRRRRGGERFQTDFRRPHRTLKNLFQEAAVPPWVRRVVPLLWCGDELVWIPDIGVAADFRCAAGEPGVVPEWVRMRP